MGRRKRSQIVDVHPQTQVEEVPNTESHHETEVFSAHEDDFLDGICGDDHSEDVEVETKCRGPTLMAHIWNQPSEKRILVKWNKRWQPIGVEGCELTSFLGTIARNPELCSLAYTDWRLVPKEEKTGLLKIVKEEEDDDSSLIIKESDVLEIDNYYLHYCQKIEALEEAKDDVDNVENSVKLLYDVKRAIHCQNILPPGVYDYSTLSMQLDEEEEDDDSSLIIKESDVLEIDNYYLQYRQKIEALEEAKDDVDNVENSVKLLYDVKRAIHCQNILPPGVYDYSTLSMQLDEARSLIRKLYNDVHYEEKQNRRLRRQLVNLELIIGLLSFAFVGWFYWLLFFSLRT